MAEVQAVRDVVQELLRIELQQFGIQIKDILCQVIREEMSSRGSEHRQRRRSSRMSSSLSTSSDSPRSPRAQSILFPTGQVMALQKSMSRPSIMQKTMSHISSMQQGGAAAGKVPLKSDLEFFSELNAHALSNAAAAADANSEDTAPDLRLLPYMRGMRTMEEKCICRTNDGEGRRSREALHTTAAAELTPRYSPPDALSKRARWKKLLTGHKDSYRQLELVPQSVDSNHESLLHDLEDLIEGDSTRDSRSNSHGGSVQHRRTASRVASKRMRRESNAWESENDSLWAGRHRRGHDANQDKRGTMIDVGLSSTWKRIMEFVNGSLWARVTGSMVVINAIEIGIQADYEAVNWTEELPAIFPFLEKAFCIFFVLELLLRACFLGLAEFFCKPGQWHYNLFDLGMVTLQVMETMQPCPAVFDNTMSHLSTFRMLRLMRILRLARILHLVSELRMLIVSISHSVRNLGWVVILLLLMIYVLAVYLTQIVTDFKVQNKEGFEHPEAEHIEHILTYYGSVDRSVLSLYAMVSEGVHWRELSDPLAEHISPWISVLFSLFSAFAFLAVMNVVTGVFVESAIHTAVEDKKMTIASQLGELFRQSDEDGSGTISWDEFQAQLSSTQMQTCLKEVDVDPEDAEELFRLLDIDRSGTIDVEELVHGTMRLMGFAKAIDLATFMHEYRLNGLRWASHARCVEGCLVALLSDWAEASDDEHEGVKAELHSLRSQMSFQQDVQPRHASIPEEEDDPYYNT